MSLSTTEKVVLGGAVAVAAGLFLVKKASASTTTPTSATSAGTPPPAPGDGAVTSAVPANTAIPFALTRTDWHVATGADGQQSGTYSLIQNAANANDWVLAFTSATGTAKSIVTYGSTPNSGLIAQAMASIV